MSDPNPTPAEDFPFVATVRRPDLPDVYLGFAFRHQAERASWLLMEDLRHTQHVDGTTIDWSPTPDGVSPLPPAPTEACRLAELIKQEGKDLPMGHAFPDLFSRVRAQEGYDQAVKIWTAACWWLDAPDGDDDV